MMRYISILLLPFAILVFALYNRHHVNQTATRYLKASTEDVKRSRRVMLATENSSSSEPSHIQMCRAMLNRPTNPVIIVENHSVCHNNHSPYSSLLQIFASALLDEVSSKHQLNVLYRHKCNSFQSPQITVQEMLPDPLFMFTPEEKTMSLDVTMNLCRACIGDYEQHVKSSPECLLFPASFGQSEDSREEATERRMREQPVGFEALLPTISKNLHFVSGTFFEGKRPDWELNGDTAIIYLSCKKEGECTEEDIAHDYKHVYAQEIPSHVKKIDIVATQYYAKQFDEEARNLKRWLENFFPRTKDIRYYNERSTAAMYSRILKAKYMVCPPSLSCLLPAITASKFSSIIRSPDLYPWIDNITFQSKVKVLDPSFEPSQCLKIRGREGKWVQDHDLAPSMQYVTPINYIFGTSLQEFQPTAEIPHLPSTTYKWVEKSFPQCPVDVLNRKNLCSVLKKLKITRIFYLGDSLTRLHAESLWKLVGNAEDPGMFPRNQMTSNNWSHIMDCPDDDHKFIISLVRNDFLSEKSEDCRDSCYPWVDRFLQYPGKSVLMASTGPHFQEENKFQRVFDDFLNLVDSFPNRDDLIFFRTSVPGHSHCQYFDAPFEDHKMYEESLKNETKRTPFTFYRWFKFSKYNDYAEKVLRHRERHAADEEANRQARVQLLDVYPMTVLRPDGHRGKGRVTVDCLHYDIPGPIDWWNHMLYSHLVTLAQGKGEH